MQSLPYLLQVRRQCSEQTKKREAGDGGLIQPWPSLRDSSAVMASSLA